MPDNYRDGQCQTKGRRIFAISLLCLLFYFGNSTTLLAQADEEKPKTTRAETSANSNAKHQAEKNESFFSKLFGGSSPSDTPQESWPLHLGKIVLSFLLAGLLAAAVAFRPRKQPPVFQPNPYVAQTQILLSVIAAAMMMIVSDNAARAFGIFAAASLVRYRTNIRDPKETSVLLACLGIGLASGVRRWEIAVILALFIILLLLILEALEPKQVFRTMELKVKSRDVDRTDQILKRILKKRHIQAELRKIDLPDEEDALGTILYFININPTISTDQLTEQFFSSDPKNIDTVEWEQKKSNPYIYR
jgi:hypothetical protein